MKPLSDTMAVYSAYHRNGVNKAIHFVMVPAIVWSLMVALDHVKLFVMDGFSVTLAMAVTAVLLVWYLMLDFGLGVASVAVFTFLLVTAMQVNAATTTTQSLLIAGGVFVGSWIFQFLGHGVWEKRRPALMDNLFQVLVAPIFLVAEFAFGLGLKQVLKAEVERKMVAHLPESPAPDSTPA